VSKLLWLIAGALLGIALAAMFFGSQSGPRRDAVGEAVDHLFHGGKHPLAVIESSGRAATACCNLSVIRRATQYIATTGSNTQVYREIIRIAGRADHDCPLLEEVLDLAIRKRSESVRVVTLAERACQVENASQEAAWRKAYDALEETAEYPSVAAALADTLER
jgi:hypothetical protein